MIRPAWHIGRHAALCLALTVVGGVAAQEPERSWKAWSECGASLERLEADRAAVAARSDSLAIARAQARARGNTGLERALLARGEALVDSLRSLAAAALAQELVCDAARARALESLDEALSGRAGELGASPSLDTLLARRERLRAQAPRAPSAEFDLPAVSEDAPPEILLERAAYARDLADRVDRWLDLVQAEERSLANRRLAAERARLLSDQAFFEEPASVRSGDVAWTEAGTQGGLFGLLIQRMPQGAMAAGGDMEEILSLLKDWLEEKKESIVRQAQEWETRASRGEE